MQPKNNWLWLTCLVTLLLGAASVRYTAISTRAASASPVWGSKPVLSYFLLTESLAETLRSELGLSDAQYDLLRDIAIEENDRLRALEVSSLPILQDEGLSLTDKRQQIDASGYNQNVLDVVGETQSALQSELDETTYNRLVEWIEQRWLIEQEAHGMSNIDTQTGERTYSIYATRFDTGSYIVALPDGCLKIANGGNSLCNDSGYDTGENYSVRLEYEDSTTARVGDSGPWNVDDNYWSGLGDPQPRRLFPDLPTGMPEAQAAYFDDYNDGEDQYGRKVTAPFGIDLADEVSVDIGLDIGKNDWIDVTFQWTDGWDDIQAEVVLLKEPSELEPPYTGDMCETAWHRITGYDDHAYLTLNVDDPSQSTNSAEWRPDFPEAGEYQVLAYVPNHSPIEWECPSQTIQRDTSDATYTIEHAGGSDRVSGNQRPLANMWLDLGTYEFEAGRSGKVTLDDVTDEESYTRTVAFSAMLFRKLVYPTPTPEFTATPTVTPTPTPTPAPFVWTGDGIAPPGGVITIPLGASYIQPPGVVSTTLNLSYDPDILEPVACKADPQDVFAAQACDLDYERDGTDPDTLQLSLGSASGVSGSPKLAEVGFSVLGVSGETSLLDVVIQAFSGPGGAPISVTGFDGRVCVAPCRKINFLPVLLRALLFP
jgi:hypothetical protein